MIKRITSLLLIGVFCTLTTVAMAKYKPPVDRPPPSGKTRATGSRGICSGSTSNIPLTLLAPLTHVGQTSSEHPVLAWFVPFNGSMPIELSIYEENKEEFDRRLILVQQMRIESKQGIMKVTLPKSRPGLKVGNRYLWEVNLMCNPENRTRDLIARAEIDRVSVSPNTNKEQLWYDLLASSMKKGTQLHPSHEFIQLLEQLAEIEADNEDRNIYFKEIADLYDDNFTDTSDF